MQVAFPSEHGLKTFLSTKNRVEIDLASMFSQHLTARPDCDVETALFLVSPDTDQKNATIYDVTESNCSECLSMLKESDVFQFGPVFQLHQSSYPSKANGELLRGVLFAELIQYALYYTHVTIIIWSECTEGLK